MIWNQDKNQILYCDINLVLLLALKEKRKMEKFK